MFGRKASEVQGNVRDNHIVKDEVTSRDLLGFVRGRCSGCSVCGKYIIFTKEKYYRKGADTHPDCDTKIMNCSRCGCPSESHEIDEVENERERGNDAVALENYDAAIVHYTRAIELNKVDWRLWSNRSKCYSAKRWYSQALMDAERACLLSNENYKVWYRKSIALKGLGRYKEALDSIQNSLKCLENDESPKMGDVEAIQSFERDLNLRLRKDLKQKSGQSSQAKRTSYNEKNPNLDRSRPLQASCNGTNNEINQFLMKLESTLDNVSLSQQDITSRLDKLETLLEKLLIETTVNDFQEQNPQETPTHHENNLPVESLSEAGSKDNSYASVDDVSHTSGDLSSLSNSYSSDSSLSEAIQRIENAWKTKIGEAGSVGGDGSSEHGSEYLDREIDLEYESSHESEQGTSESQDMPMEPSSRKASQEYQERTRRIRNAEERLSKASHSGEPLSCTDIDMLTQQKRTECLNCEGECPGFKIYYNATDVHDPEIMFYCSLCGCNSEHHIVDSVWQDQEILRKQREEQEARIRVERMKYRQSRQYEAANKIEEAYNFLGLQSGSSKLQIKAAYKSLAKKYHPDKQKNKSNKEDLAYMQQMFTKATDCYKLLIDD